MVETFTLEEKDIEDESCKKDEKSLQNLFEPSMESLFFIKQFAYNYNVVDSEVLELHMSMN